MGSIMHSEQDVTASRSAYSCTSIVIRPKNKKGIAEFWNS